jgi:hypothetical protein
MFSKGFHSLPNTIARDVWGVGTEMVAAVSFHRLHGDARRFGLEAVQHPLKLNG